MKKTEIDLPSNKKFGYFFSIIFIILGSYFFYKSSSEVGLALFLLSLSLIIVTFFKDELLLPLNKSWMMLGILLGKIISPIILGLIFFLIFTPVAIVMKIFNRDILRLKISKKETYWIDRKPEGPNKESFKYQF